MVGARAHYDDRRNILSLHLATLERRYNAVAWSRLATLLPALVLPLASAWVSIGALGWTVAGVCAVAFTSLVVIHGRIASQRQRASAAHAYFDRGIQRLDGRWASFPEHGQAFHDDDHAYGLDLDIFGTGSVFQLINDARTPVGERMLAGWLKQGAAPSAIAQRQIATRELSALHSLREEFAVAGATATSAASDPAPFVAWASGPASLAALGAIKAIAWGLPSVCIALAIASSRIPVLVGSLVVCFLAEMALLAHLEPKLRTALDAACRRSEDLQRFAKMIEIVEKHGFESSALKLIQQRLGASGAAASVELGRLSRIVSTLEARENGAFRATLGVMLLWDVHGVAALERWQRRVGPHVPGWIDALAETEALCSLATFAFEHPGYCYPEVTSEALHFEATGLGHPLLDAQRVVVNTVSLPEPGAVLLVTGSNMSGKSTLLRAVGIAAVLAQAGAPVCAWSLRMSACQVCTSMRISDSVRDGVSRFYAEILKIKRVVDAAGQEQGVLFLLDEILHGTNSRERHIGARSVIRTMVGKGAIGAVSTHDLALADLSETLAGKVRTVHFQEQLQGEEMSFDYQLREGVVTSGNALRWMRRVGLPVEEEG